MEKRFVSSAESECCIRGYLLYFHASCRHTNLLPVIGPYDHVVAWKQFANRSDWYHSNWCGKTKVDHHMYEKLLSLWNSEHSQVYQLLFLKSSGIQQSAKRFCFKNYLMKLIDFTWQTVKEWWKLFTVVKNE